MLRGAEPFGRGAERRKDKRRGSGLGPRNIKIAVLPKDYDNDKILMALVSMTSPPTLFVAK